LDQAQKVQGHPSKCRRLFEPGLSERMNGTSRKAWNFMDAHFAAQINLFAGWIKRYRKYPHTLACQSLQTLTPQLIATNSSI
jgi:hypothetical protein